MHQALIDGDIAQFSRGCALEEKRNPSAIGVPGSDPRAQCKAVVGVDFEDAAVDDNG